VPDDVTVYALLSPVCTCESFIYHVKLVAPVAEAVRATVASGQVLLELPEIDAVATAGTVTVAALAFVAVQPAVLFTYKV
jgi:hypothetical protein